MEASQLLVKELDLFNIIKQLRVNKFTSECYLTKEQKDLVPLHRDWLVYLPEDMSNKREEWPLSMEKETEDQKKAVRKLNTSETNGRRTYEAIVHDVVGEPTGGYSHNIGGTETSLIRPENRQ